MPARPAWPLKSAPRLFIDEPIRRGQPVVIDGNQAHYLTKVMRAVLGSTVVLCDDVTGEWSSEVVEIGKRQLVLSPLAQLRPRESVPDIWLCPALLKKDRFDLVLEKATELGVAAIRPMTTRRCVADKLNADRARAIVVEAAEQCARTALPEIAKPVSLDKLLADWPSERELFFADENGGAPAAAKFAGTPCAAILIGPEGGFDDAERAAIRAHPKASAISLGPRILRAETAAIGALALWMGQAGDWSAAGE